MSYETVINNKRIYDYYKKNPSIQIETMNLILLDFMEQLSTDMTAVLQNTFQGQVMTEMKELRQQIGTLQETLFTRIHKTNEEFIEKTLPTLQTNDNVISKFETYWGDHKNSAFKQLCAEENIAPDNLEKIIHEYEFANKFPRKNVIKSALTYQPRVIESKTIVERIAIKIRDFLDTYIEGMGGST